MSEPLIIKVVHHEEFTIERDDEGFLIEPRCPNCHVAVDRPKCPWERGGDCARHGINDAYKKAIREDPSNHRYQSWHPSASLYGQCRQCIKPQEEHRA